MASVVLGVRVARTTIGFICSRVALCEKIAVASSGRDIFRGAYVHDTTADVLKFFRPHLIGRYHRSVLHFEQYMSVWAPDLPVYRYSDTRDSVVNARICAVYTARSMAVYSSR